jgi:NapC/NirT cytochrome c family, N-terminal region
MTVKKIHLPRLAYNTISLIGAVITLVTGVTLVSFLIVMATIGQKNSYLGIFVYLVLPLGLALGLLLIPIGMLRTRKRLNRSHEDLPPQWPHLDLNRPTHRHAFFVVIFVTGLLSIVSIVGGYQAYQFTESVEFCGKTCHTVMKPEYTAYGNSPHARVSCAECHVGAGAGWYAKSKLSGAYQVYAATFNKFPRPIPTPIKNLRPAQETCEQCHWPEKFFGAQQRQFNHYMYDDSTTHWQINMLIKTGGGDPKTGQTAGIHWHMNIGSKVEYIARDEKRQDIPWVRITEKATGRSTVYQNEESPLTKEEIAAGNVRRMDCMDCHNRPSHRFRSPDYVIDQALLTGLMDPTLPEVKRIAVEAMTGKYNTEDEAQRGIAASIRKAYQDDYPDVLTQRRADVDAAVAGTQLQYSQNLFPAMKVTWEGYPDNIGHFIFPGCMRCHNNKMKSEDGRAITRACTSCHVILRQGTGANMQSAMTEDGLEFNHPDGGDDWRDTDCYECHTGTQP